MTLTTTNVTGAVPLPNGLAPHGATLRFALSGFDLDGAVIAPVPVDIAISDAGEVETSLWPNARGLRETHYTVALILPAGFGQPERQIRLGSITVPEAESAPLHELLLAGEA